jgi:two-component system, LytTR family, sensor kinase
VFDKRMDRDKYTFKRFWVQAGIQILLAILIILPVKYLFRFLIFQNSFYVLNFEILYAVILIINIITFNLLELGYFFQQKWRFSLAQLERFKKQSAEFRFETLVNQVNPHFLFNSLNTLSSLIYHDRDLAAQYIRELAKVYRYVLENKDNELVKLRVEQEFIKSYVYLFELRFKGMISFLFEIPEEKLEFYIAPMTVQLLIENAVKHNIISEKRPLSIRIYEENNFIVVANKHQKKNQKPYSSGMGLQNIRERYAYLSDKEIIIDETQEFFIVKIPLIFHHEQ